MKKDIIARGVSFLKETYLRMKSDLKNDRPIFIVGCGHSGTTLMLRILANHRDLYGVDYESKAFQGNYAKISKILEWRKITRKNGKTRWVEKTPKHIQYIGRIFSIFPKAKVIIMQRDGRDVIVSIRKRFGSSELGVNRWIQDNKAGLRYKKDQRVSFVKLEELGQEPENVIRELCHHLEIDYYSELLDYQNTTFKFDNHNPQKTAKREGVDHIKNRVWQVNQPISKNTSKWKEQATSKELEIFEKNQLFRDIMKSLKYFK